MAKANFERAKEQYPSITQMGEAEWLAFFDTREGFTAIGRILGDIYQEIEAQKAKARGKVKMGRRPGLEPVALEKVFEAIFPEKYSQETFADAFRKLAAGKSQRQIAAIVHCSQAHVFRLLNGTAEPSMSDIEQIARAFNVEPNYFTEWRAMFVAEVMSSFLRAKPNLGIGAVQHLMRATRGAA